MNGNRLKKSSITRMRVSPLVLSALIIAGGILMPYCGSRGPLTIVPPKNPLMITGFKIVQIDTNIILKWKFPALLSDNTSPLDSKFIKYVLVYHSNKKFTQKDYKKNAKMLFKLRLDEISKLKDDYLLKVPFKSKSLDKKNHYFGISYRYKRKRSPISNIQVVSTRIPARKIEDLTLTPEKKTLVLKWSKPKLNIDNKPVDSISGYNVYRSIETSDQPPGEFIKLNGDERILKGYYEDKDTSREGTYSYYVTTIHDANVESIASNTVKNKMKNIYPPSVPQNLICIKDNNAINLIWQKVEDKDFAYYRVYRKQSEKAEFKIHADKLVKESFTDPKLKKGITYHYRVSAVDTFGNESELSNQVKETF